MQFCTKCGAQLESGARFCPSCGAPVPAAAPEAEPAAPVQEAVTAPSAAAPAPVPASVPVDSSDEVVDLTGMQNRDVPQEERYKPLVRAGLIVAVAYFVVTWVYAIIVDEIIYPYVFGFYRGGLGGIIMMAVFYVPIAIIGLLVVKARKAAEKEPVELTDVSAKAYKMFLVYFTILSTLSTAISFAWGISSGGNVVRIFLWFIFVAMLIAEVIYCRLCAMEMGKDMLYGMLRACFLAILPGIPLGYLLVKYMVAMIVLIVIGAVALFSGGGFIIIHRRD